MRDGSGVARDFLTTDDIAARTGKCKRTLERWRAKQLGPPWVRIDRTILYPAAAYHAWLADGQAS